MQVKTQIILEDAFKLILIIAFIGAWLYMSEPDKDNDTDTDFPKHTNTVDVHVKQVGGINSVLYRKCILLADKVEC
jgi:hypothetical protein